MTASPRAEHRGRVRRRRSLVRRLIEFVITVLLAVVAALLIRSYAFASYMVPTGSMEPTILPHDRIMVNKLAYDFGSPEIGQIVVFNKAAADPEADTPVLVKRLIGLPGDRLWSGPHGEIFVNGKLLKQPWLTAADRADPGPRICAVNQYEEVAAATEYCHNGVLTLPKDKYWMMGDNRGDSYDSRFWGAVPASHLIGPVLLRMWPLGRIHWF